jgi:hypothetical protein
MPIMAMAAPGESEQSPSTQTANDTPSATPEATTTAEAADADVAPSPDEARARDLFMSGRAAWNEQRYDEACDLFQQSQNTKESPAALLNLGRCHEMHHETDEARISYRAALGLAEQEQDETKRNLWRSAAFEALERLGPEETPEPEVVAAPVVTAPVVTAPVVAAPREAPPPPADQPRPKSFFRKPATPWVFLGSGAGLILGSIASGVVALNAENRLARECSPNDVCDPSLSGTKKRAHAMAITTDVLWISGAVLASTGVVLLLTRPKRDQPSVGLGCNGLLCGASVSGRF